MDKLKKLKIKEAIVVEGRDDTAALQQAAEALIIETHGFGITRKTWELLEKAYNEKGLIIFTDPDFSGEEIRRRISERFPLSKHAYMPRKKATKRDDVGIENANPEDIKEALEKVSFTRDDSGIVFTLKDLEEAELVGSSCAKERRETLGSILGIGYGNSNAFLKKLNRFGITKEQFNEGLKKIKEK
ncbi:MAG: ribonuclease M5 [Firmicutes bacterium]|jgi:ribonuclease M5|nr:ribonuclease M5 [Bacillota bacterium]